MESNETDAGFAERLKELIGDETVMSFSRRCGIGEGLLRKYLTGSKPGLEKLVSIADAKSVTLDWLATGKGKKQRVSEAENRSAVNGFIEIPFFKEVRASAGHGALNSDETDTDTLMFREQWIRKEMQARPTDLFLIRVKGDSMDPTLRSGDIILINKARNFPDRDGIYILLIGDTLLVKRVQCLPGRTLRITSDNSSFASYEIEADKMSEEHVSILGRVVWVGSKL